MSKRLMKVVTLVLLGVLVAILPGLVGCGQKETEAVEIRIGFQGDFTGPGSAAVRPVYDAFMDYLDMAEQENLLSGAKLKVITYDNKTDYSRYTPGYVWLQGQGVEVMLFPSATDIQMNERRFAADEIPAVSTTALDSLRANEWAFFLYETHEAQTEGCLQWIVDTWDYQGEGRNPRVGHIGFLGLVPTIAGQAGIDQFLAANPGKIEWRGAKLAPIATSTWAVEAKALLDCDYVFLTTFGAPAGTIVKEARLRGYTEAFISHSMVFPGFWSLVESIVAPSDLYGIYHQQQAPWCDESPFATEWKEAVVKYHPGAYAEREIRLSGYSTGWAWGIWMIDVIKRAIEKVGVQNVDGSAIRDALATTDLDMTSEGWGGAWRITTGNHILVHTAKTFQWSIQQGKWIALSDWIPIGPAS